MILTPHRLIRFLYKIHFHHNGALHRLIMNLLLSATIYHNYGDDKFNPIYWMCSQWMKRITMSNFYNGLMNGKISRKSILRFRFQNNFWILNFSILQNYFPRWLRTHSHRSIYSTLRKRTTLQNITSNSWGYISFESSSVE